MVSIPHPLKGIYSPFHFPRPAAGPSGWVAAGIVLVGASAMLPVLQKSTLTSRGFSLQEHQANAIALTSEIRGLESEVGRLTSRDRLALRAFQIGLRAPDLALHVNVSVPGPEPAKIPIEFLPPQELTPEDPIPWWRSFVGWLPTPW